EQNEDEQCSEEGDIVMPVMPHLLFGLSIEKVVDELEDMLQLARVFRIQAGPENGKQHHYDRRHQKLHGDEVSPGPRIGCPAYQRQRGISRRRQVVVE